jgi:hypothetical protein
MRVFSIGTRPRIGPGMGFRRRIPTRIPCPELNTGHLSGTRHRLCKAGVEMSTPPPPRSPPRGGGEHDVMALDAQHMAAAHPHRRNEQTDCFCCSCAAVSAGLPFAQVCLPMKEAGTVGEPALSSAAPQHRRGPNSDSRVPSPPFSTDLARGRLCACRDLPPAAV